MLLVEIFLTVCPSPWASVHVQFRMMSYFDLDRNETWLAGAEMDFDVMSIVAAGLYRLFDDGEV